MCQPFTLCPHVYRSIELHPGKDYKVTLHGLCGHGTDFIKKYLNISLWLYICMEMLSQIRYQVPVYPVNPPCVHQLTRLVYASHPALCIPIPPCVHPSRLVYASHPALYTAVILPCVQQSSHLVYTGHPMVSNGMDHEWSCYIHWKLRVYQVSVLTRQTFHYVYIIEKI